MFLYFPEYLAKNTLNYIKLTFNDNNISQKLKEEIGRDEDICSIIDQFKFNKIKLPKIEMKHCNKFFSSSAENLRIQSSYDKNDNQITLCNNIYDNNDDILIDFKKELSISHSLNIKHKSRSNLTIQERTQIIIDSCIFGLNSKKVNKLIKNELIRRCAYIELKYKFGVAVKEFYGEDYCDMEDLKLNEIVRKLVDQNFIPS